MGEIFHIKKPTPLFRRGLRQAPAMPIGARVLVREVPPETVSEGGIALAEKAIERLFSGYLVSAGLKARDFMWDNDICLGDLICYAKYAGIIDAWRHIVGEDDLKCAHDGAWDYVTKPSATLQGLGSKPDPVALKKWSHVVGGPTENVTLQECRACGTLIVTERVIVMSMDDMMTNMDAQERYESGEVEIVRGQTADGQTQHVIERKLKEAA